MSTDRDTTRIVRSWLDEGTTAIPDRVLDAVLDQVPTTPQRRPLWPAWRIREMNNPLKLAIAAVAVVVVAIVAITLLPGSGGVGGPGPLPTPSESVTPTSNVSPSASNLSAEFPDSPMQAGTYTVAPFSGGAEGMCHAPPQPGCTDAPADDDAIRVSITVPDGWSGFGNGISGLSQALQV